MGLSIGNVVMDKQSSSLPDERDKQHACRVMDACLQERGSACILSWKHALAGLLAVLAAVGPEAEVDLYGFNWSLQSYKAHIMNQEELIVRALARSFRRMDIHPTACSGLYTCETICDTGQFRLAVDEEHCRIQVSHQPILVSSTSLAKDALWHPSQSCCTVL